jgi:uncharacterized membrane protein required for colicin V production
MSHPGPIFFYLNDSLKKSYYLYLHPVLIQYFYQTKLNKVSIETGIFLITRIIQRKITLKLTQLLGLAVFKLIDLFFGVLTPLSAVFQPNRGDQF